MKESKQVNYVNEFNLEKNKKHLTLYYLFHATCIRSIQSKAGDEQVLSYSCTIWYSCELRQTIISIFRIYENDSSWFSYPRMSSNLMQKKILFLSKQTAFSFPQIEVITCSTKISCNLAVEANDIHRTIYMNCHKILVPTMSQVDKMQFIMHSLGS